MQRESKSSVPLAMQLNIDLALGDEDDEGPHSGMRQVAELVDPQAPKATTKRIVNTTFAIRNHCQLTPCHFSCHPFGGRFDQGSENMRSPKNRGEDGPV
jgi:hypothetical protein